MTLTTFTYRGDDGVVAFTELERPAGASGDVVAGGILGGDTEMIQRVRAVLAGTADHVVVVEPNVAYRFSAGRDTLADVAAAMMAAGNGRGELSERGWQILDTALDGGRVDDDAGAGVVY
ncbi:MAG: hypothetical protein AB7G47_19710 [Mycolicibacterium sp.]|uniref:hypothetical protein n=1 Tax=Mycolicibacterium sp. TaxID=2320850 RepID=UPI003D0AABF7